MLNVIGILNSITNKLINQANTQIQAQFLNNISLKRIVVFIIIFITLTFIVSLIIYYRFTEKYKLKRSLEHYMDFVKIQSMGKELNSQLKQAEQHESRGEVITRAVLESMFNPHKFPKVRLEYILNPVTMTPLEFDCYNDELKLAVEYNGIQHYKFVPYFHKTRQDFYNQQYRDRIKQELCDKYNIELLNIPYTVSVKDLPSFIASSLGTSSTKASLPSTKLDNHTTSTTNTIEGNGDNVDEETEQNTYETYTHETHPSIQFGGYDD